MSQVKNLRFSGTVGPVIFYYLGDKLYERSMPRKVRQTKNTRARSANFGTASATARILRNGLAGILPDPKNKTMQNRFSGAISRWLGTKPVQDIPQNEDIFNGFTFGEKPFPDLFRVPFTVSKEGDVYRIQTGSFNPVQMIHAPAGAVSVQCIFSLASCALGAGKPGSACTSATGIALADEVFPGMNIELRCDMQPGILTVIVAALIFMVKSKNGIIETNDTRYRPCSVIKSLYTGTTGNA